MRTRRDALIEVTLMLEACGDWLKDYQDAEITQEELIKHLSEAVIEQLEYKDFDNGWREKEEE